MNANKKRKSLFLIIYILITYVGLGQVSVTDTVMLKLKSRDSNVLDAFDSLKSEHYLCFKTGENTSSRSFRDTHIIIVCTDKNGLVKWKKRISSDYEEKVHQVYFHNNALYFLCSGEDKLEYDSMVNKLVGLLKIVDLKSFNVTEYYFKERAYAFVVDKYGMFVLTKELGCANNFSAVFAKKIGIDKDGKISILQKTEVDSMLCFNTRYNNTGRFFKSKNSIEYLKEEFVMKNEMKNGSFVTLSNINSQNFMPKCYYSKINLVTNQTINIEICSDCNLRPFKIISSEKSVGVIIDSISSSVLFYNSIANSYKTIGIEPGYGNFEISVKGEEIFLAGRDKSGENGLFIYIKNEKVVWTKKAALSYHYNATRLISFMNESEIIVYYLDIVAGNNTESNLRKITINKSN